MRLRACKVQGCVRPGLVPRPEGGALCIEDSQALKLCELCPRPGTVATMEAWLCDGCMEAATPGVRLFSVRGYCFAIPLEAAPTPWCGPRSHLIGWKEREYNSRGNG